ncbi:MAG: tyrosine-type recombinase/integrase, partial [bacterium]
LRPSPILPAIARAFMKSIEPTRRPGTCLSYRSGLAHFHRWLDDHGFAVDKLSRSEISGWFHALLDKGLHPATRIHRLGEIRIYLHWLDQQGLLQANPDELIRVSDFPKMPQYLPRPLPPDVDRELQRRLAASTDFCQRGLRLMRNTGIRVGELAALEYDCIRLDLKQRPFLKVPLGKLQNERLVPLEPSIYELVQSLQRSGPRDRTWLLEDPAGQKIRHGHYARALREAAQGLTLAEPLTTHRLRHTYATSLLAGGMSLLGVMKLLGHRDYRMTLRYTAITDETIGREYDQALKHVESRYRLRVSDAATDADPVKLLADVIRWIRHHLDDGGAYVRPLLKRIERLQAAVQRLRSNPSHA